MKRALRLDFTPVGPLEVNERFRISSLGQQTAKLLTVQAHWAGSVLERLLPWQNVALTSCSPNEDAAFASFSDRFVQLVSVTAAAASALNAQSRSSRAVGEAYRAAVAHQQSKTSWCLTQGNPNIPRFQKAEASLNDSAQRAVDVMFANVSGYFFRLNPMLDAVAAECRYINGGSTSAQGIAVALQRLQQTEERFEFGLADARIQATIRDINAKYQTVNSELGRAITQLYSNASDRLSRAEAHVARAATAFAMMNEAGYDGQVQFDAGELEIANYNVQMQELSRFILIDDGSGRLQQLHQRTRALGERVQRLWAVIPMYLELPDSASYDKYGHPMQRYGKRELLDTVEQICAGHLSATGPLVSVGAMSYEHGGTMQFTDGTGEHKEHKRGLDADLDLTGAGNVGTPNYNPGRWTEFLKHCAGHPQVVKLLFSDQAVVDAVNAALGTAKVKFAVGHTAHCHLSLD